MALKDSEVKKLKILGVVMVLLIGSQVYRHMKKRKGTKVHKRPGTTASRGRARRGRRGRRGRAPAAKSRTRQARSLTPADIPVLEEDTKAKLQALKNPKQELFTEDELRYETTNIYLPLDLTDKAVEQQKKEAEIKARGGKPSGDTIFFRGVMQINGERMAILERADRRVPWYVREGEALEDSDFVLKNIAGNNMQVTLLRTNAKRERDRIRTIPWCGQADAMGSLAAAGPDAPPGKGAPGVPGEAVPPPSVEKTEEEPDEDDFEIME